MIKSNEWTKAICGATNFPLNPDGLNVIIEQIQTDVLRHAAQLVHDMSRGTKSEERAIAIDEARDIIMDEIKIMAAVPNIPSSATPQAGREPRERNGGEQ